MQLASIPDLMLALPEIVLAVASLALLMLGVFLRGSNIARTISYACIILLIVTIPVMLISTNEPGSTFGGVFICLLYTSPSPRDRTRSRMPSSA